MSERCATRWPLEDANEEDRQAGNEHACSRSVGHIPPCRCVCGEKLWFGVESPLLFDQGEQRRPAVEAALRLGVALATSERKLDPVERALAVLAGEVQRLREEHSGL